MVDQLQGVDQTFSGRFSPIFRGLVWAKLVAAATRVKARDINPLQKIFFIFLLWFNSLNLALSASCKFQTFAERAFLFFVLYGWMVLLSVS
jgi:hypothetical protein